MFYEYFCIQCACDCIGCRELPLDFGGERIQQPTNQQTASSADSVRLTEAQQVYQLYNQGQAVSQIASNLSLTENAVNGYLGNSGSTG